MRGMVFVLDTPCLLSTENLSPTRSSLTAEMSLRSECRPAAIKSAKYYFSLKVLADKSNFPLNLKFGRPTITTNEKIVLASIFYPLFALAVQLSPEQVGVFER